MSTKIETKVLNQWTIQLYGDNFCQFIDLKYFQILIINYEIKAYCHIIDLKYFQI
jgi:hypothetical protein